jgi:hypothetical protein
MHTDEPWQESGRKKFFTNEALQHWLAGLRPLKIWAFIFWHAYCFTAKVCIKMLKHRKTFNEQLDTSGNS